MSGNGYFKWIASGLLSVSVFIFGVVLGQVNEKIDTVKADSTAARSSIEARVNANEDDIDEIKVDIGIIKEQSNQMLRILTRLEHKVDTMK